uniref:SRP54-type proteins GTP-binding domain-containing protein n=1 Tax=Aegilops tauschii subsp. strangulata TaxID=200361 RepID=A0A453GR16_AEGTS
HPPRPPHQGEGQERRRQALLRLLQDPREPLRRRRAAHLLEPRRHRPRPRRPRGGAAGVGLRAQDLVPDRRHPPRPDPRRQAQVRDRDQGDRFSLSVSQLQWSTTGLVSWSNLLLIVAQASLKRCILELLTTKGSKTELQLGFRKPAVIMIVGVNGGGKTTSLGKLAYRFKNEGAKVLMAAGDTFRAAARDQLEIWAERTGSEIVIDNDKKAQAPSVLSQAVKRGKREGFDVVLCDTSGRLHTNYGLMEELVSCKKVIAKALPGAPNEILLVLDGTTGLNMLQQAKEFNDVVGITGFILTKLDGTARGGCVVSVVDELGIPVKFVGVGEGVEDLQPFDAEAFVEAIFP